MKLVVKISSVCGSYNATKKRIAVKALIYNNVSIFCNDK
jgi:hypothetical protein